MAPSTVNQNVKKCAAPFLKKCFKILILLFHLLDLVVRGEEEGHGVGEGVVVLGELSPKVIKTFFQFAIGNPAK